MRSAWTGIVVLAVCSAGVAAFAAPPEDAARGGSASLQPDSWLRWAAEALAAQEGEGFTATAPPEAEGPKVGQYKINVGFRLWILGRDLQATHVAGRPRQWASVWNNEQVDQDSEWFIVQRVGAIRIGGEYVLMPNMTLAGGILVGANASTLEYRIGPGNVRNGTNVDISSTLDTEVGWYPVDMYYGLEVEARYAMQDFLFGARLQVQVASAPFDSAMMAYAGKVIEGWITTFTNDLDLFAAYKTPYGTPRGGIGISIYECWSHQEEIDTNNAAEYKFHFRETQWLKVLLGYRYETKDKFYFGLEFNIVAQWNCALEVGYQVM
jgi:hypothetical protein